MIFLSIGARLARVEARVLPTYITGLICALVGGFGLLARIGVPHGGMPAWAVFKVAIWIVFASVLFIASHKPGWAKFIWPLVIFLGATATYLAGNKPF